VRQNSRAPEHVHSLGVLSLPLNGKGSTVRTELNTTEARQGTTRPRAMLVVLIVSLMLAVIAGGLLALGWISLPGV
jgi:hypothetical protein